MDSECQCEVRHWPYGGLTVAPPFPHPDLTVASPWPHRGLTDGAVIRSFVHHDQAVFVPTSPVSDTPALSIS